jgi:hypothetical protein
VALAVRGVVKTPTGDKDAGVSTGKPDFAIDLIVSKETAGRFDVSAFGGYEFAANPTMSIRPAARSAGARVWISVAKPAARDLRDHRQRAELRHADVHRTAHPDHRDNYLANQQPDDGQCRRDVAAQ